MLKKFYIELPLEIGDSFELVRRSGDEIVSWGKNNVSEDDYYLEWKQSFWSITGTSLISVKLDPADDSKTLVTVLIHKPMQVFDPVGICYRVFRKLEKSVQNNLAKLDTDND